MDLLVSGWQRQSGQMMFSGKSLPVFSPAPVTVMGLLCRGSSTPLPFLFTLLSLSSPSFSPLPLSLTSPLLSLWLCVFLLKHVKTYMVTCRLTIKNHNKTHWYTNVYTILWLTIKLNMTSDCITMFSHSGLKPVQVSLNQVNGLWPYVIKGHLHSCNIVITQREYKYLFKLGLQNKENAASKNVKLGWVM